MQESPRDAKQSWQDWCVDLETSVRVEALAEALAIHDDQDDLDDARISARAFLDEPALQALPMSELLQVADFIEAGWEFSLGDLVAALDGGQSLRTHLTGLVARRLRGVVTHFDLDPAEILARLELKPPA